MASVLSVKQLVKQDGQTDINPTKTRINTYYSIKLSDRSATAAFDVLNAVDPVSALAVPQDGDPFGSTGLLVLSRRPYLLGEGGTNWEVQVINGIDASITDGSTIAPWTRKPLIEWGQVRYPYVLEQGLDEDNTPVVNSAEDPYDPPLMTEKINGLMRITWAKKTADLNIDDINDLIGTVNGDSVTIRGKSYGNARLLLRAATATETIWTGNIHYWALVYEIEVERQVDVFVAYVLDRGYHRISGGSKSLIKVNGSAVSSPQLLDGNGAPLAIGGTPVYNEHVKAIVADWSPLLLA